MFDILAATRGSTMTVAHMLYATAEILHQKRADDLLYAHFSNLSLPMPTWIREFLRLASAAPAGKGWVTVDGLPPPLPGDGIVEVCV